MEDLSYINKNSISNRIVLMRSIFLRLLGLIYLIAFISLHRQFQGLWGDEGLLPAKNFLMNMREQLKEKANVFNFPTLAWWYLDDQSSALQRLFPSLHFGSSIENYYFLVCIVGIIFSFCIVINIKSFMNSFSFFVLWFSYLNFFLIQQNFQYEWDSLLMEVGFIAVLFAPSNPKNINVITPVDNVCYYLLRFIIFKIQFGIGMHIFGSKCPYWLSISGLNFYFQSLPLPSSMSILLHHLPEGIKKLLSSFGYFMILDLPFGYFLIWRRFNIFAGQLTIIFQVFIMLSGNYGFLQLLILVVNLANFDDYYLRGVIPTRIIEYFNLSELEEIIGRYLVEKEAKDLKEQEEDRIEKEKKDALTEKYKNATEEEKKKLMEEIVNLKRQRFNIDDYDDNAKIEELFYDENQTSFPREIFIFFNLFCLVMIFLCFYKFPLNKLLTGAFQIATPEIKESQTFVSIYMILIFIYFNVVIFTNIIQRMKSALLLTFAFDGFLHKEKEEPKSSWFDKVLIGLKYLFKFSYVFLIIVIFILYFVGNVQGFYTGLGLTLVERNTTDPNASKEKENKKDDSNKKDNPFNFDFDLTPPTPPSSTGNIIDNLALLSDVIFQRLHSNGIYSGIQGKIRGVNGRSELEIEYFDEVNRKWKSIEFLYKISLTNQPKTFIPYLPRLEFQMSQAAYSSDINKEPWLAILLGKILENNPVIMDLIGYEVPEKELYYRLSAFERISNCLLGISSRNELPRTPKKVKIEQYTYAFVGKKDKKDKIVKRKHMYEFLANIEKYALSNIFKTYHLPPIDEYREVNISPFQQIPIVDILIIGFIIRILIQL